MCICFLRLDPTSRYSTVVGFNRDEFLERDTRGPHWWEREEDEGGGAASVFGGRDLIAGGTWLGVTSTGRIALLTNFRERIKEPAGENGDQKSFFRLSGAAGTARKSRGLLVKDYLDGSESPQVYCERVVKEEYSGYNLVVGDLETATYAHVSNRACDGVLEVKSGEALGVSNGPFNSWWKVERGTKKIEEGLPSVLSRAQAEGSDPCSAISDFIFDHILSDGEKAPENRLLPQTGFGDDIEMANSSIFVEPFERGASGKFGTRTSTVLVFDKEESKLYWWERAYSGETYSIHAETIAIG